MILKAYFVGWTRANKKFKWRQSCDKEYARHLVRELRAAGYRDARMASVTFSDTDFPKLRQSRSKRAKSNPAQSTAHSRQA